MMQTTDIMLSCHVTKCQTGKVRTRMGWNKDGMESIITELKLSKGFGKSPCLLINISSVEMESHLMTAKTFMSDVIILEWRKT